jgi:hypothetical protein
MRSWVLAAIVVGLVLSAPLGALLIPSSGAPRAANVATFVRDNSLTVVNNPNGSELTIDDELGTALWDHTRRPGGGPCCPGGKWAVTYDWRLPQSFTTGEQAQVTVELQVSNVDPEQDLYFQMSVLAPDFTQTLGVNYPDKASDVATYKFPISAGYANEELLTIKVRVVEAEITYYYKRAPTPALGQKTKPMPAPGESVSVSSPETIPAKDRRTDTSVTNSGGNLNGTTVVADAKTPFSTKVGEAVAACFLIGPEALDPQDAYSLAAKEDAVTRFAELEREIEKAEKQNDKKRLAVLAKVRYLACFELASTLVGRRPSASAAASARCQATRLEVIVQRNRRGRATGLKLVRRRPGKGDVRYSCAVDGPGAITITADGRRRGGLRKGLGKKLDFGVVRERGAEPASGRLTFSFGV